ncbi:hypothetical protein [Okeania sp. KiyG1]|nr:hypothetical protein [Okeania sp. KiyG1]
MKVRKKEEGRGKKEEGRRKKAEGLNLLGWGMGRVDLNLMLSN